MNRTRRGDGPPLAGLGPRSGVPRLAPSIDWSVLYLDDIKGFVLSRIDGRTTLGEILLLTPFPESQTVAILTELFARGIIELPGVPRPLRQTLPGTTSSPEIEPPPPPPPDDGSAIPYPVNPARERSSPQGVPQRIILKPSASVEVTARELTPEVQKRIDEMFLLAEMDLTPEVAARLLGLEPGADKRAVKRSFFALSKEFHPDRFFRKNLGDYERKLHRVFNAVRAAYESLDGTARK